MNVVDPIIIINLPFIPLSVPFLVIASITRVIKCLDAFSIIFISRGVIFNDKSFPFAKNNYIEPCATSTFT